MNTTQFEAIVIQAVDALRSEASPEDDRIEFKRGWPTPDKARQLAAAANQAQGDHIIYVIGVDERDGTVHPTDGTDPATWWTQLEARFDQVAPELVRHINVQVSSDEHVVGLLFRTDRAPYVVKVNNGGAVEREIPIRSGTRTRSAKRHELLRMLLPSIGLPSMTPVSAQLGLTNTDRLDALVFVFFAHLSEAPVFFPWHDARIIATAGDITAEGEFSSSRHWQGGKIVTSVGEETIAVRSDGIRVAESGTAAFRSSWQFPENEALQLENIAKWKVRIELGAVNGGRPVIADFDAHLGRHPLRPQQPGGSTSGEWHFYRR